MCRTWKGFVGFLRPLCICCTSSVCLQSHSLFSLPFSLKGNKVSRSTHTYPHNPPLPPQEDWSDHMQSPGWQPTLCVAWCLIWWFEKFRKSMVIHDTECPYWDQVSLNNTNQTKPLFRCVHSSFGSCSVLLETQSLLHQSISVLHLQLCVSFPLQLICSSFPLSSLYFLTTSTFSWLLFSIFLVQFHIPS